jgi:ketosteroid isomerase-like protein
MAQENVELTRQGHDAVNRRDLDALLTLHDPDVEISSHIMEMEGRGVLHGHDGVRSWFEHLTEVFPDFTTEIEQVSDYGAVTITRLRFSGHGTESRAPMKQIFWQVVEWRDEKILWWRTVTSEAEALEAAGL